jgi:exodeoxyribonuclease-5
MDVRNDKPIPMGDYGGVLKIPFSDLGDEDLLAADQVLTGANATRWGLNQLMMKADGFDVGYPMLPGVKTICLRNNKHHGLFNGMIGRTTATVDASMIDMAQRYFVQGIVVDEGVGTEFEFEPHRWHMGPFQDNWDPRSDEQKLADQQLIDDIRMSGEPGFDDPNTQYHFDLAYAVTTHKSQGSQWGSVLLVDDGFVNWKPESRRRWLYTALTRAVDIFVWAV